MVGSFYDGRVTLNGLGEFVTAIGLAGLLFAEAKERRGLRAVSKCLASAGFIVAALGFGALESRYGRTVLTGLLLGAVGDVCLLGSTKKALMSGLVAFLLGHVAYVLAFGSLEIRAPQAFLAAVAMATVMALIARWVFPHAPDMRAPISVYMLVIATMVVTAVGAGAAGATWMISAGAILFTLSDVAVVRQRFVKPELVNRLWGLPMYYIAQLLIAWSIAGVNAGSA